MIEESVASRDVEDAADAVPPTAGAGDGEAAVTDAATTSASSADTGFSVRLDEFEGPFDLLLSLIAKHKLDVTVLALHTVIDDFLAHIRAAGPDWDLDEATEFLVVAATLLDLKAARLLPSGEVEDEEDLALLEARDLLFARLLQYRAYKEVSAVFAEMMRTGGRRHPREVGLDPAFAGLLPEVLIGLGPLEFAALAAKALEPKAPPTVSVSHIHAIRVSVKEQAVILVDRLKRHPSATFRSLTADCDSTLLVVARFLAILELYREGAVAFDQVTPLGELHIRWTGSSDGIVEVEEYDGTPAAAARPAGGADAGTGEADGAEAEDTPADEVTDADISDYFRPDNPPQDGADALDDDEEQP